MIGLKRHTVHVVEHDPNWITLAATAYHEVWPVCRDLLVDLQHVGSTAVPALPAKPILDLAAAVTTMEVIPELVQRLTQIGYIYRGNGGNEGGHLFIRESAPDIRTIHMHIVEHHGTQWRNYLLFRDLMRDNAGLCLLYAELKQKIGNTFKNDRNAYTAAKYDFIQYVLKTNEGIDKY
ncbi:MAG: GrpB family protein [Desulfobulbus sp.]|nr:GrpB family protein [Desulfobulbus sp.]